MTAIDPKLAKGRVENAKAIGNCLAYLAREARDANLHELAKLIDVAILAAREVTGDTFH